MITATSRALAAHFGRYRSRRKWPFLSRITLEGLAVPLVATGILTLATDLPGRTDLYGKTPLELFLSIVILAPFIETLLLQCLPVMIARRCGAGFNTQLLASLVPFAALHFLVNIATGIAAGVFAGFYIAFTYVHWRGVSFRAGLWMTAGTHALHNLVLFLPLLLAGSPV